MSSLKQDLKEYIKNKEEDGYYNSAKYAQLLLEAIEVIEFYGDESSWKTMKHCESDTISRIRTDASDYDTFGYSEYGEASRLMLIGGKKAREFIKKNMESEND